MMRAKVSYQNVLWTFSQNNPVALCLCMANERARPSSNTKHDLLLYGDNSYNVTITTDPSPFSQKQYESQVSKNIINMRK
jgi:hypothetical protein